MNCNTCGLPKGSDVNPGLTITITIKPENGFQRSRKSEVWACCSECAHQSLAISKYGAASHKWPIPLAKFRSMNPLPSV